MGHALLTVNDRGRRGQDKFLSTLKAPASINSINVYQSKLKVWEPEHMASLLHGEVLQRAWADTGTQLRTIIRLTSRKALARLGVRKELGERPP